MQYEVNQDLCIGCGSCVSLCPTVFKLNEAGKAEVISQSEEFVACVKDAVSSCPVQAINIK